MSARGTLAEAEQRERAAGMYAEWRVRVALARRFRAWLREPRAPDVRDIAAWFNTTPSAVRQWAYGTVPKKYTRDLAILLMTAPTPTRAPTET